MSLQFANLPTKFASKIAKLNTVRGKKVLLNLHLIIKAKRENLSIML